MMFAVISLNEICEQKLSLLLRVSSDLVRTHAHAHAPRERPPLKRRRLLGLRTFRGVIISRILFQLQNIPIGTRLSNYSIKKYSLSL